MSRTVRCSIIIPVFNHASLTRQCLQLLLGQVSPDDGTEVIVVDDGSTDHSAQLLEGYRDRVRVIRHDQNQGFASACNDGAAAATGELLILLNNDTLPAAGWLGPLTRYADAHPEAGAVGIR